MNSPRTSNSLSSGHSPGKDDRTALTPGAVRRTARRSRVPVAALHERVHLLPTMTRVDVHTLALEKVGRILGPARARTLLQSFLARTEKLSLATTADLQEFGEALGVHGGIEQAVGALLMVQAVLIDTADPHEGEVVEANEP